jgi:hypothetical protein
MKYTVDYFINKFKAIPSSKWTTGQYTIGTKCCALGHCGERGLGVGGPEAKALGEMLRTGSTVVKINDGEHPLYLQKTPRARILAALKDLKKAQK